MAEEHKLTVDVAVIGAGTAGLAAYRAAVARGVRAVILEAGEYGTTCARVGCMPSKLLIAAAEAAHIASEAGPFGVNADVRIDGAAVMARVRRERDRFAGFVVEGVAKIPDSDKIRGHARFIGPGLLSVDDRLTIEARSVVIATGSSPVVPAMFEAARDRMVINDDVFAWEKLPASVAVFGAGVIGLEIGQALHRLGVRTRVFGRGGTVGPITDPVVREAARAAFASEFRLDTNATVHAVRRENHDVTIDFDDGGVRRSESFEYVLVAAGRRPNIGRLGLEHAGIELDAHGIPTFDRTTLQCGDSSVFIAGDVNNDVPILHEAADEGRIAGENAATAPRVVAANRRTRLAIAFTEPQIALAGSTWAVLSKHGAEPVVGEVSFDDQGRSRVMRKNRGLGRVYADARTGRFLGAEFVGPSAEHLGHLLAWAHQQGLTIDQMLAMPFYHPVVEEGLRTALRDASAKLAAIRAGATREVSAASSA